MESLVVVLTAYTVKKMDSDNLVSSVKYYRDEVARFLDIDDGDERVQYVVKWKRWNSYKRGGVEIAFVPLRQHLEDMIAELTGQMNRLGAA